MELQRSDNRRLGSGDYQLVRKQHVHFGHLVLFLLAASYSESAQQAGRQRLLVVGHYHLELSTSVAALAGKLKALDTEPDRATGRGLKSEMVLVKPISLG